MVKWLVGVLGTVVAGILVYWLTVGIDTPFASKPYGILDPDDGSRVAHRSAVEGKCSESEAKMALWLVVQPVQSPHFHPQPGPLPKDAKGHWKGIMYCGASNTENVGEEFLVFIVSADATASQAFSDYLVASANKGQWHGFQTLPAGTTSIDSIRVIRK